jgi:hypothetical protein
VRLSGGFYRPTALQIVHPYRQPTRAFRNCRLDSGGCSHICKPLVDSYVCECPDGFQLKSDNRTCEAIIVPTLAPIVCNATCDGSFKRLASSPTFEIPNRHGGYLNKAGNEIQYLNDGKYFVMSCIT